MVIVIPTYIMDEFVIICLGKKSDCIISLVGREYRKRKMPTKWWILFLRIIYRMYFCDDFKYYDNVIKFIKNLNLSIVIQIHHANYILIVISDFCLYNTKIHIIFRRRGSKDLWWALENHTRSILYSKFQNKDPEIFMLVHSECQGKNNDNI